MTEPGRRAGGHRRDGHAQADLWAWFLVPFILAVCVWSVGIVLHWWSWPWGQ